jgi:hypothetical protein
VPLLAFILSPFTQLNFWAISRIDLPASALLSNEGKLNFHLVAEKSNIPIRKSQNGKCYEFAVIDYSLKSIFAPPHL